MGAVPFSVWVSAASVVSAIGLTAWVVAGARRQRSPRDRFSSPAMSVRELSLDRNAGERFVSGVVGRLRAVGAQLTPVGVAREYERRIARAGLSHRLTPDRYIAVKALLGLGVFLLLFLIALGSSSPIMVVLAAALSVLGFFVPDLILDRRGADREALMRDQLADVADQILIAVEAGASLDAALDRVTRASEGPLQSEFRRMLQDISFGLSRKDAITAMIGRTTIPELRELLLAISQSEEHGLSIGNILRVQTSEIRERRKVRAEEAALKVPVKLVFPLILCILPCLLAIIVGPAVVQIARNLNF